jgi:hypothetical protein
MIRKILMPVAVCLAFVVLAAAAPSLHAAGGTVPARLGGRDFKAAFYRDVATLRVYTDGLEGVLSLVDEEHGIFSSSRTRNFDAGEGDELYAIWASYLDYLVAIESLNERYKKFSIVAAGDRRADEFLIGYASYLAKISAGFSLIRRTIGNELYEKKLDDAVPDYNIPAGLYGRLKWNTLHLKDVSVILAGHRYFEFLGKAYRERGLIDDARTAWLFPFIETRYASVMRELKDKGAELFAANGLDILRDKTFAAWFPLQAGVSEWLGDTKVRRPGKGLITPKQIRAMRTMLRPGDIIVERRNWYLSNIGLPGFWPHAELYTGDISEMARFFDDETVKGHFRALSGAADFIEYLTGKYPDKMKEYRRRAADGEAHRVIEAVSEGVKLSSLREAASADYIGAMRPRLSKLDIAQAIDQAFNYLGRPYDFNFDFLTDGSIVCSELVYKSYMKGAGKRGLDLRLREIAGRKAVPPNDIVEKFDREFGTAAQQLDFVYFLDGSERDAKAVEKGLTEFRESYRRPKWDISQK